MDIEGDRAPLSRAACGGLFRPPVHRVGKRGGAPALYAAIDRAFPVCFAWLGLALLIDGIDGTLARARR